MNKTKKDDRPYKFDTEIEKINWFYDDDYKIEFKEDKVILTDIWDHTTEILTYKEIIKVCDETIKAVREQWGDDFD